MKLPAPLHRLLRQPVLTARGLREYLYDYRQFVNASSAINRSWTPDTLGARIVKEYHRLEKGLALPEPRPGFGRMVIRSLLELVPLYEARFGVAAVTLEARAALRQYRQSPWCEPAMADAIDAFLANAPAEPLPDAGAMPVTRAAIQAAAGIDFAAFAAHRYSVRDFTGAPVPPEAIEQAVAVAMKSPRVCNRGTTRCHVAFDPAVRARALALQNGNAGFGHLAGAICIITASRTGFTDFGERNQCWIDGGLFAMSLCYALHAAGYGTCMLNWSVVAERDRELHRQLAIPEDEAVITMMAVGEMKPAFRVAISPREPLSRVFRPIDARLDVAALPRPDPAPGQP